MFLVVYWFVDDLSCLSRLVLQPPRTLILYVLRLQS